MKTKVKQKCCVNFTPVTGGSIYRTDSVQYYFRSYTQIRVIQFRTSCMYLGRSIYILLKLILHFPGKKGNRTLVKLMVTPYNFARRYTIFLSQRRHITSSEILVCYTVYYFIKCFQSNRVSTVEVNSIKFLTL